MVVPSTGAAPDDTGAQRRKRLHGTEATSSLRRSRSACHRQRRRTAAQKPRKIRTSTFEPNSSGLELLRGAQGRMIRTRLKSSLPLPQAPRQLSFRIPRGTCRSQGFTLIELLVVISILVVLGALAFPAVTGALDRAKKVQAKNDLVQIAVAVNAFHTEYGVYPIDPGIPSSGHDVEYGNPDSPSHTNSEVMNALRAINDPSGPNNNHALNPRRVVFFTGTMIKDPARPRGGFDANGEFWDPWGSPDSPSSSVGHYIINIDANYDGLTQAYTLDYTDLVYDTSTGKGDAIRAGVIGASLGRDGDYGKKGDKKFAGSDDGISW